MSDTVEIVVNDSKTGTVGFEYNAATRQYEKAVASIYLPYERGTTEEQTSQNARDAFFQAKSIVFEQLGIEFSLDENGVVRSVIEKHLGPVTEVTVDREPQPKKARPVAKPQAAPVHGLRVIQSKENPVDAPVEAWLYEAAEAAGVTKVFDNRGDLAAFGGKVTTNRPWYVEASDDRQNAKAFWPPKDED